MGDYEDLILLGSSLKRSKFDFILQEGAPLSFPVPSRESLHAISQSLGIATLTQRGTIVRRVAGKGHCDRRVSCEDWKEESQTNQPSLEKTALTTQVLELPRKLHSMAKKWEIE